MRAMILQSPAPIKTAPLLEAEIPQPEPGPGQIRVEISCCGICHTDLHIVEGELAAPLLPLVPGHRIVGTVDKLGPGARPGLLGQRVGLPWLHGTCGSCDFCRAGQENLCPDATFTGLQHHGGYAEYAIAEAGFAEPLPAELAEDAQVAPLLCAGIIGYRALRVCGLQPGENIGLYGFGASAHLAIQVARYLRCKVFVFSRSEEHLARARDLGADVDRTAGRTGAQTPAPRDQLHAGWRVDPRGHGEPAARRRAGHGGNLCRSDPPAGL